IYKVTWVVSQTPAGRIGQPEDIAAGAFYQASDKTLLSPARSCVSTVDTPLDIYVKNLLFRR
ncbi:MAG TPA: hypothetical protein VI386_32885, partial [Candidatus Sulfotelmatobacter sp.]